MPGAPLCGSQGARGSALAVREKGRWEVDAAGALGFVRPLGWRLDKEEPGGGYGVADGCVGRTQLADLPPMVQGFRGIAVVVVQMLPGMDECPDGVHRKRD